MSRDEHIYDRTENYDLNSGGTIVEINTQGLSEVSTRLGETGTDTNYQLEVSNDGDNWWTEATFSTTQDIDDSRSIPERYARLRLDGTDTVDDTADAEITASG